LKVCDLKKGMMLTPSINRWTKQRQIFRLRNEISKCGRDFLYADIVSLRSNNDPSIAIYMGWERSDFFIWGIKKHHFLLVDGKLARLTGYDFQYIEKASTD